MGKDQKGRELGVGYSQRKDGLYRRAFRVNGKQVAVTGSSLKECKKNYLEALRKIEEGVYSTTQKPTLDAYMDEWIKNKELSGKVKGSTLNIYKGQYKRVSAEFGKVRIDNIKPIQIKAFQRALATKYSPATVNHTIGVLQNILETAVEDELILRNPCSVVKNLSERVSEGEERNNARAMTDKEVELFMQYAKDSYYYNAIRLLFATGMRTGEMRGLMWSDYDTENNLLHIRRTASVDKNGDMVMNTPKSRSSKRSIPITPLIKEIIEEQRQQNFIMNDSNVTKIDDYIFKSLRGKVISRNVIKSEFDRICNKIIKDGYIFERVSPHAARHTFITNALHNGMNEYLLKDIVGHAPSARVTTEKYLDRNQDAINEAMQRFAMSL